MPRNINYNEIKESNNLILKDNQTIQVEFLDDGIIDDVMFDDGDTSDKYVYQVKDLNDDNKVKIFSIIQMTLLTKLVGKPPKSPKGMKFSISRFRTGTGKFDVDYRVTKI